LTEETVETAPSVESVETDVTTATTPETQNATPIDLTALTRNQLLAYAEEHQIKVESNWSKARILEVLQKKP
jgi:hypothetical protein